MNPQPQMDRRDPPPPKAVATMAPKRPEYKQTEPKPAKKWGAWRWIVLAAVVYYLVSLIGKLI